MKAAVAGAGPADLSVAEVLVRRLFCCSDMNHSIEIGKYAALEIMGKSSMKNHFNRDRNPRTCG